MPATNFIQHPLHRVILKIKGLAIDIYTLSFVVVVVVVVVLFLLLLLLLLLLLFFFFFNEERKILSKTQL